MSAKRFTEEFKIEAVKQVIQRGHAVTDVAARLGVSSHSLYQWIKKYGVPEQERKAVDAQADELKRVKAELKRVTEERDILKKAAVSSTGRRNTVCLNIDWEDYFYGANGATGIDRCAESGVVA
jgi:transposase